MLQKGQSRKVNSVMYGNQHTNIENLPYFIDEKTL